MPAGYHGHLLGQPAAKATINAISDDGSDTALSGASLIGYKHIVQLLVEAGADLTTPLATSRL